MPLREPSYPPFYFDDRRHDDSQLQKATERIVELEHELARLKDGLAFMTGTGGPRILRDASEHWYARYQAARQHIIDYEGFGEEAIDGIIATRAVQRTDRDEHDKPLTAVIAYLGQHL